MPLQLIAAPLLSAVHIYSVAEEMRATPVNTLNPQRTAMIVAEFIKVRFTFVNLNIQIYTNMALPSSYQLRVEKFQVLLT